jgi:branched-chain amino acid transport system ATP-binding protein
MFFKINQIIVHYQEVMALKGISMSAEQGEIVTIIGANGAGKSTTLKAISGLKTLTSGEIYFQGKKISGLSTQKIVALGVAHAPEARHIFSYMNVRENLLMGAYLRKDKEEIQRDLGKIFAHFPILAQRFKQEAGVMSGGEQQMLAIGRALMAKPRLLLLDEPSLGLSPFMVREIAKTIVEINNHDNISIILVEQNARMALKLSNRGYVMETGKISLEGNSTNLANDDYVIKAYLGG